MELSDLARVSAAADQLNTEARDGLEYQALGDESPNALGVDLDLHP